MASCLIYCHADICDDSACLSLPAPCSLQWHALSREEQAKYYELARKERQLHMQLYPGWSARDNYVCGPLSGEFSLCGYILFVCKDSKDGLLPA